MTIDKIESVLGVFYDWSGIARLLKKIDEEKYQKYIHFEKTVVRSWTEDLIYEIVYEVIAFNGVDFGVFRYSHDIEDEIEGANFVFGFIVSSVVSGEGPYLCPFEEVLKNLEVLKMVIDDKDIPTFHTIPDDQLN